MTTTVVEALSFASLTTLLSSPPQYPRNPTHEKREPLVLYIVRVPGCKDVVLTPLKPPTKTSISLDAIQSSLYYLHVETEDDEIVRQSLDSGRRASAESRPTPVPIQRKPLPPTSFANYPPSRRPPTPPKSYPHYQPGGATGDTQHDRYAARGSHLRLTTEQNGRPLGARPMPSSQSPTKSLESPTDSLSWDGESGRSRADTLAQLQSPSPSNPTAADSQQSAPPVSDAGPLTKITLIRRDPTSGAQWNVGTIRVGARRHQLAPLQPVEVVLTAPGYTRFARNPDRYSPDSGRSTESSEHRHHFKRTVGFRSVVDDQRTSLQDLRANSNDLGIGNKKDAAMKKSRQVYSFSSPWDGVCIFSNGVDGKSLRLRHSLLSHKSFEGEQGNGVAELRLNLPWSALRMKDANRPSKFESDTLPISQLIAKSKKDQWRRSMQHFKHDSKQFFSQVRDTRRSETQHIDEQLPPKTVDYADENHRISLRLGREKAGGGFKGDSAKLGKLILDDEGLKMGDLVVASCMGVFWQHSAA